MTALTGQHYINGAWTVGGATFQSDPVSGDPVTVYCGGAAEKVFEQSLQLRVTLEVKERCHD